KMEILLCAAGTRRISEAIERVGVKDPKKIIVGYFTKRKERKNERKLRNILNFLKIKIKKEKKKIKEMEEKEIKEKLEKLIEVRLAD
ncbi:MAG: hypothetical protein QXI58_03080, partial [Candidatus Micrarchaeia archaeon]